MIPCSARRGEGIPDLLKAIKDVASGAYICKPYRIKGGTKQLKRALDKLQKKIEIGFPGISNARWVALRLLEGDPRIIKAVQTGELNSLIQYESQGPSMMATV